MSTAATHADDLSAETVARFLQDNPAFLQEHAEVFATLEVPHPHQSRAISLGERQILTLRERQRELEWRLNELVHNASTNEGIGAQVQQWCERLLAEQHAERLPALVTLGLAEVFDLKDVGLRLWAPLIVEGGTAGESVSDTLRAYADALKAPYCGPAVPAEASKAPATPGEAESCAEAASWLTTPPASMALVPLRPTPDAPAFGLLVLGSPDAERFAAGMGTSFLARIGRLGSAALARLTPQA